MDRADPGAGQHRDRRFGDHGEVDGDSIPPLDAEALERVGGAAHFAGQLPVGHHPPVARLALPDQRGLVAARSGEVAVEAVGRDVQLAIGEPPGVGRIPVEHPGEWSHPIERPGLLGPEGEPVGGGLIVQGGRGVGVGDERGRRREPPLLVEESGELVGHGVEGSRVGEAGRRYRVSAAGKFRKVKAAGSGGRAVRLHWSVAECDGAYCTRLRAVLCVGCPTTS